MWFVFDVFLCIVDFSCGYDSVKVIFCVVRYMVIGLVGIFS